MEEAQQHKEIQKGFNTGYLLEKLNPQLAEKLRAGMSDKSSPFILGMLKGAEQYKNESFFDSPLPLCLIISMTLIWIILKLVLRKGVTRWT